MSPRTATALAVLLAAATAAGADWSVTSSPNFRVFHHQTPETAARAARLAERTRLAAARKWLGKPQPPWPRKCDVYLHATAADYARATAAPPGAAGHASVRHENGRVTSLRIDLPCDTPEALASVLPHETTHVVLAARFGQRDLPRWADEGIAVLSEPRAQRQLRQRELARAHDDDALFSVAALMGMSQPPGRRAALFYAQSASLVAFLSKQKKPAALAGFLRRSRADGFEAALADCYGYRSFAELERAWRRDAFAAE
jgi:hypothetical protein